MIQSRIYGGNSSDDIAKQIPTISGCEYFLRILANVSARVCSRSMQPPKSEYSLEEVFVRHYFQLFAITNRYSAARERCALAVEMLARFTIILDVLSAPKHFC